MKRSIVLIAGIIIQASIFLNCAQRLPSTLRPIVHKTEPHTIVYIEPEFNSFGYKTFSVFPVWVLNDSLQYENDNVERQLLFFLKISLEERGYKFFEISENPDFLATINIKADYKESYVRPKTQLIPYWIPGKTITTYTDYSAYGSWGSLWGTSKSDKYIPGEFGIMPITKPGYYEGSFYPLVEITIFDTESLDRVWTTRAVGKSNNPDIRVSSQVVTQSICSEYPKCNFTDENYPRAGGRLGFYFSIFTTEGNRYVPIIMDITKFSPAYYAGLKRGDLIISVDNNSSVNTAYSNFISMVDGPVDSVCELKIWRKNKIIDISITRASKSDFKKRKM